MRRGGLRPDVGRRGRCAHRQAVRRRCQPMTVAGWTISSTWSSRRRSNPRDSSARISASRRSPLVSSRPRRVTSRPSRRGRIDGTGRKPTDSGRFGPTTDFRHAQGLPRRQLTAALRYRPPVTPADADRGDVCNAAAAGTRCRATAAHPRFRGSRAAVRLAGGEGAQQSAVGKHSRRVLPTVSPAENTTRRSIAATSVASPLRGSAVTG